MVYYFLSNFFQVYNQVQNQILLVLDNFDSSSYLQRTLSLYQNFPIATTIINNGKYKPFYGGFELPDNVNLLTLRLFNASAQEFIVRLQHIYEINENSILSKPASVCYFFIFNFNFILIF